MKSLLSKSFKILRRNLLFLQPVLLYFLLILIAAQYIISPNVPIYSRFMLLICIYLFTVAIFTGMFHIDKKAIDDFVEDDTPEAVSAKTIKNIKLFFEGIGENFIKTFFASIIIFVLYILALKGVDLFCNYKFSSPSALLKFNEIAKFETVQQMSSYLLALDVNEFNALRTWGLFLTLGVSFLNFFASLYFAVLLSEKSNFLICFVKTIVFLFRNIVKSILIMIFMFFLYLIINILMVLFGANTFVLAIFIILIVLYFNYYIILVLNFYNDKEKTNSNSWSECVGENESCD